MRRIHLVIGALALGCALITIGVVRSRALSTTPQLTSPTAIASAAPSDVPRATEGSAVEPEITDIDGDSSFNLHVFSVHVDHARLRVLDLGMSRDLEGALRETGASLVVNGGFFDRLTQPEGLVISEGRELSPKSETLGGGVLVVTRERADLYAAEGFALDPRAVLALQARPRLVVGGKSNIHPGDAHAAERTALCVRDEGRVLEVILARGESRGNGPTLALFADMLASRGCEQALNLDGGPSTGVAWRASDGVHTLAPRGPLRHGVAIWVR